MTMSDAQDGMTRRDALGLAALGALGLSGCASAPGPVIQKRRIRQSLVYWCFHMRGEKWDAETVCATAKMLGCESVELCPPSVFPVLKRFGLTCAIAPNGMKGAPFMWGLNNKDFHEAVFTSTKRVMDACSDAGFPGVIAFNGFKWKDPEDPTSGEISREAGAKNCIEGLKELARYGEKKQVTVHLEMLNTRVDETMKGHPGYQGDDIDYVAEIVRAVGSERVKVLFDIYHVQIMHRDIMRRLHENRDVIGHIHTAGNPGRGELDDHQEIHYPGCMHALLEQQYQGFVGHEFIPTRDPLQGLREACQQCDV